ncbi:MAG TPA: TonB family protein [Sphingobacteriaceae bacterium]
MKLTAFFICGLLVAAGVARAQNRNIYFLKNSGKEVEHRDSADYIRIIEEPDTGSVYFPVTEVYANQQRKFIGQVSSFEPSLIYEGATLSYYANGKKKQQVTYEKGWPTGLAYYFDINGKPRKIVEYGEEGMERFLGIGRIVKFKVVSVLDSTGVEMVTNGNGTAYEYSEEDLVREEGTYVNGVKQGRWSGADLKRNITFQEIYESGKLVKGTSVRSSGETYEYNKLEKLPEFKGGADAFNRFLSQTIRYPPEARSNGITGRVFLQFVIAADGSVQDVEVVGAVHPLLDREAASVMKRSPRWIPATQKGIPVKVMYRMPINFQLGR